MQGSPIEAALNKLDGIEEGFRDASLGDEAQLIDVDDSVDMLMEPGGHRLARDLNIAVLKEDRRNPSGSNTPSFLGRSTTCALLILAISPSPRWKPPRKCNPIGAVEV